ncbi:Nucleotide binding,nucleic acid binding,RNA binding [Hibiscus syriacus]|uniref:Nucleotide binding,nucleic acid binding,RNA binding n=1 Tax=Hibiscus syriacus TaxID=106335 RepID=A0A6A2XXR8_HIBSY|nr:Nucleotide binding,nucleic acid binding,RNA binding [Hibiscus syriacus]
MLMSSSYMSWRSSATANRRPTQRIVTPKNSVPIHPDPNSKPVLHFLASGLIIFLGLLQFLPASHFRDPSDPLRKWVAFNSQPSSAAVDEYDGVIHIISWMRCLDLKVLSVFTNSTLYSSRQEEVKEAIKRASARVEHDSLSLEEITPFIIPSVHQSLRKFLYVSPNLILMGRIEELTGIDLAGHGVAAAEDCSKRLNSYVNSDVSDAIQRSASKP